MRVRKAILKALKAHEGPLTVDQLSAGAARDFPASLVKDTLRHLVGSGHIVERPKGHFTALPARNSATGRLSVNPRGYGFVVTPAGDVYVAGTDMAGAMHNDIVDVRIYQHPGKVGPAGEVTGIVKHANERIVGRFEKSGKLGVVTPTDRRVRGEVLVGRDGFGGAQTGQIVVARITRFAGPNTATQGVVEEVLGLETDPGVDVEIVIREHDLHTQFSAEVEQAAHAIPEKIGAVVAPRVDLRDLFTITIDPVDARDFDDAISLEKHESGWRLWVHIADVSEYVPWGSAIDEEAVERATSVYLVDRVLPMLPERLSNGICSLNPGVDRFTMTAEFDLDRSAKVLAYKLYPSAIRSDHRLDYDSVQHWLETDAGYPDDAARVLLTEFRTCAAALGKRRIERGGLDFESAEAKVWLDPKGKPLEVTLREKTVATNMIEEAMIAANEVVARHMRDHEAPMVYRIHEDPEPDALAAIAAILTEFDYPIKDLGAATPRTFQRLIAFAANRPERLLINSLLLRALKRARYVDYLDSHFGLASDAYCHFTSPIRRYPDLIVHRLLRAQLTGKLEEAPTADMVAQLADLADHSSVMEREAESAERDSVKVKLVELMAQHIGEVFPGIISGVAGHGAYVQLDNTAEGIVHVMRMTDDHYKFDADRFMLVGERTGTTWRLGQEVEVRITDAIISDRRIEMEWAQPAS